MAKKAAELKLPIYGKEIVKGKFKPVKVYTTSTFMIRMGTIEDIIQLFDIDGELETMDLVKLVAKNTDKLYPILMDLFAGVTQEELRDTNVVDLVKLVRGVIDHSFELLNSTLDEEDEKN